MTWKYLLSNHCILERDGYFISYNSMPFGGGGDETAICIETLEGENRYLILCGDHRDKYEQCSTLEDCIEYYIANYSNASFWCELVLVDSLEGVLSPKLLHRLKDLYEGDED